MQRIDVIIGIVLVAAVVASAVGVATYEDERSGAAFRVTWATRATELSAEPATIAGSGEASIEIPVEVANLTRLAFEVTVAGSQVRVQPTQVLVEVAGPDGFAQQAETEIPPGAPASETIALEFEMSEIPTVKTVQGASPQAAAAALAAEVGPREGAGTWTIRVSVASSAPGPLAEMHTVTVTATAESFEAELAPDAPDVNR